MFFSLVYEALCNWDPASVSSLRPPTSFSILWPYRLLILPRTCYPLLIAHSHQNLPHSNCPSNSILQDPVLLAPPELLQVLKQACARFLL
jgi:hypothetical protein